MHREKLIEVYLDWLDRRNNFLTVGRFAEYYGLYETEAEMLIALAKSCHDNAHPEA